MVQNAVQGVAFCMNHKKSQLTRVKYGFTTAEGCLRRAFRMDSQQK